MSSHRLAFENEAVAVVDEPIEDCIGEGPIAEHGREPPNSNE